MSYNFAGQSLIGRSFVGCDLSGADFGFTDIRSANFTGADLTGANFQNARAGLSKRWKWLQTAVLLICSAAVGVMSIVAGTFTGTFLVSANIETFTLVPGLLALVLFAAVGLPLAFYGFTTKAFQNILVAGTTAIALIALGTFFAPTHSADTAGGMTGGLVLIVANAVTLTVAGLSGGKWIMRACLLFCSAIAVFSYPIVYPVAASSIADTPAGAMNRLGVAIVVALIITIGGYPAHKVLSKDERFDLLQRIATTFTAQGGTCFYKANLTNANFTQAKLKCADFSSAHLQQTNFYRAHKLNTAKLTDTVLNQTQVRHLAVTKQGEQQSYCGLNLTGLNLVEARLVRCDFTDCTLNHATLQGASALDADFTRTQAIGTDFRYALLTGSCVEAWNIDSTTQLDSVACEYVYLRAHQQERRPSSGLFKVGEFSKLFQEVLDTVDLIFQGGLDWKALHATLEDANQARPEDKPLTLRSIENKDDGVVVVKVDAPSEEDKATLHADLSTRYQGNLKALEDSYQALLQAKDEQIAIYREQQANLSAIAQTLASRPVHLPKAEPTSKLVRLKITTDSQGQHYTTLQVGTEGKQPFLDYTASLSTSRLLIEQYNQWQSSYRQYLRDRTYTHRLSAPAEQITNVSTQQSQQDLSLITQQLQSSFNRWLATDSIRPLREKLLENISPSDMVRIVLQTDDAHLWRLPWHSWDILSRYPQAEVTLSTQHYQRSEQSLRRTESAQSVQVLAIFGSANDLDLERDRTLLESLPDTNITILREPTRSAFSDKLWERNWNILFFAGHSNSFADPNAAGQLQLNATDTLSLKDIHYALKRACSRGLQLAIFNSCDGLGLVHALGDLPLNNMIVMREAVPDSVAQTFLQNLLTGFEGGRSLPQAVREARERLQGLEDRFPCASELPILCQTAAAEPLTWNKLRGLH